MNEQGWMILICVVGGLIFLALLFIFDRPDDLDKPGQPGEKRQRKIYEKIIEQHTDSNVVPVINTNGGMGVGFSSSTVIDEKQEVWVTEEFEFKKWRIVEVHLR